MINDSSYYIIAIYRPNNPQSQIWFYTSNDAISVPFVNNEIKRYANRDMARQDFPKIARRFKLNENAITIVPVIKDRTCNW